MTLRGSVRFIADEAEAAQVRHWIEVGLRWVDSVGSFRSQGFGRLIRVVVDTKATPGRVVSGAVREPIEPSPDGRVDLVLRLEDPLLVARFLPDGNLFECAREIPGGALKGAFATSWREALGLSPNAGIVPGMDPERPELCEHFAALRFTHVFLGHAASSKRPFVPPLSLVRGAGRVWDVARLDGACLFVDDGMVCAPAFAPDWKSRRDVEAGLGWAVPERETRVRTAIDPETRRGAEGELFAHRSILPSEDHAFYGAVDLGDVPEASRSAAAEQLQRLLRKGLRHLGKTKASAEVDIRPGGGILSMVADAAPEPGEPWILVLQTPAVLLDPMSLDERAGRSELAEIYGEVWRDLAGDGVRLVRYFASQRLAGGGYLRQRFQRDKAYHPFLLTDAGSVFVFEILTPSGSEQLRSWARHGLPLPAWAVERYAGRCADGQERPGDDWRRCPFLRQNGFGEVAIDPDLPWTRPPDNIIHYVKEVRP